MLVRAARVAARADMPLGAAAAKTIDSLPLATLVEVEEEAAEGRIDSRPRVLLMGRAERGVSEWAVVFCESTAEKFMPVLPDVATCLVALPSSHDETSEANLILDLGVARQRQTVEIHVRLV